MSIRRFLRRPGLRGAALLVGVLAIVVVGVLLGSALAPSHSDGRSGGVASEGPAHVANPLAGRITSVVGTDVAAARFGEEEAAREDFGENLEGEKISDLDPLPARRFAKPVKEYKAYAHGWIDRTIVDAKALGATLRGNSRAGAQRAWEKAWGDYMHLGADYGLFGGLEEELDGTAGGAEAATSNPDFIGFRRLEWGIWTGQPLGALAHYGDRLIKDLNRLKAALPGVEIDALDYATRGHEIVEDAQRDLMNGMDLPWSHQGVLGTAAAVASAEEVFKTLKPLLSGRENTEPEVEYWLYRLHGLFASLRHDGRYPSTTQMGTEERERMNGYVAGALSALQMVPSTLETEAYKAPPSIGGRNEPLDRRQFLGRSAAVLGAGAVGLGIGAEVASGASTTEPTAAEAARRALDNELAARNAFEGFHQHGILTPRQTNAAFVALDAIAPRQNELIEGLKELSYRAAALTQGGDVAEIEIDDPPPDSGILGSYNAPDGLTVTIAFGSTLFDHRYGLAARKPPGLTTMPAFEKDGLEPDQCHGDVMLSICADHRDTVVHTLRELLRTTAGVLTPRWRIDGFQAAKRGPTPRSSTRNLFGFRDGTANPDPSDAKLMDQLVWVKPGSGEPAWTAGGTYQVVRTIRMHVEFWDRVGMFEQTNMIGRDRVSGAPLGGSHEFEDPRYDLDPKGERIPLSAHIRLANPRTPATENQRILRRPYNYDRGLDEAGNLDQGLLFVAFNQDIARQFETVQKRLEEEEMADYITPVGGGYFFVPRAAAGNGDWVGSGLFA